MLQKKSFVSNKTSKFSMIVIVSPAKSLDLKSKPQTHAFSQPAFLDESTELVNVLKELSPKQISELMGISYDLAQLNYDRFQAWQLPFDIENSKQAIFTFSGDVYTGFDAYSLNEKQINYCQSHLKILSGLYGILKPLDLIQAYRLEMGSKLSVGPHRQLYSFWKSKLTDNINNSIEETGSKILVNLASIEYSKAIQMKKIDADIVNPVFKDWKNDSYKIISFFAKKARGLMARHIIEEQINSTEDLKGFNKEGYVYNEELSQETPFTFTRDSL